MATKKKAAKKVVKKASPASNFERLDLAGVLRSAHVTDAHKKAINKLSTAEVSALIAVRKKLAKHVAGAPAGTTEGAGQPWIL